MKCLLVTGGAGFIGSNFIRFAQRADLDVQIINFDKLTYAGSLENLNDLPDPQRHKFIEGDVGEQEVIERILREEGVDTIVHFAAESHVDRSISGPALFVDTNVVGTCRLLQAARKVWLEERTRPVAEVRFHHISTDEVYGSLGPDDPAFHEATRYAPNSPYAASKAASDHLVRSFHETYALPTTISNCSNNYGPRQFPEKLIPLVILKALAGEAIPIYGDGQQIRDWLYVDDHCDAIWQVLERGRPGETYHIGGDNQPTNLSLVTRICQLLDQLRPDSASVPHEVLIEFVPDRPGHDRRYAMDISKIRRELGWTPTESLESGLEKTIGWYLDNREWVASIQNQPDFKAWMELNYERRAKLS